ASEGRRAEAVAMLERMAPAPEVSFELGTLCHHLSILEEDPEKAREWRRKARTALERAREMGWDDPLLDLMLEALPEGGGEPQLFSRVPEADLAMRRGERAFAAGDMPGARALYEQALALDPDLYYAPLFLGDAWLAENDFARAIQWYERAVEIGPWV